MAAVTRHPHGFSVWDIVRVEFPYAEAVAARRRPALIIAIPDVHDEFAILWVLMITSARHLSWPRDVPVSALAGTGLSHASVIRTAKIATLDARLATRIGTLGASDRGKVDACIRDILRGMLPA